MMNFIVAATVSRLLTVARDLTEPGDPNHEYIRGQVNLIMDAADLSSDDNAYQWFTRVINHREAVPSARTIRALCQ